MIFDIDVRMTKDHVIENKLTKNNY